MTSPTLNDRLARAARDGIPAKSLSAEEIESLERLQTRGEAVLTKGRWFAIGATRFVAARVRGRTRGALEAVSYWRGESRTWLLPKAAAREAAPGDLVLLQPDREARSSRGRGRSSRGGPPRQRRAQVIRILDRAPERFVARISSWRGRATWRSFSTRQTDLVRELDVPRELERRVGEYFHLSVSRRDGQLEVLEELGDPWQDGGADIRAVLRHHDIPEPFPEAALQEARAVSRGDIAPDADRKDLRGRLCVTIDGETAKDFDDAIGVERLRRGFRLDVHIADVASYVAPGGDLDRAARARGTSVYFPGRAVPMLPPELSEDACSLRPRVDRRAMTVSVWLTPEGEIRRTVFSNSVIRSRARLTYTQVAAHLGGGDVAGLDERVTAMLRDAADLLEVRRARKQERGALELDLPHVAVEAGDDLLPRRTRPTVGNVAHEMIEELMITANSAVAAELRRVLESEPEAFALFRTHPAPTRERLLELVEALDGLYGENASRRRALLALAEGEEGAGPQSASRALHDVVALARNEGEVATLGLLLLRAMGQARYEPEPRGHFALALADYCHFTSPIRRYPDLVMHRLLKAAVTGPLQDLPRLSGPEQAREGAELSDLERRAERAERDLTQWQKVRLLEGREGEVFAARITGISPRGLFTHLTESGTDGMIRLDAEGLEGAELSEDGATVVTRSRTLALGDLVRARLLRLDEDRRSLDLDLAPDEPQTTRRKSSGVGRRGRRRSRKR